MPTRSDTGTDAVVGIFLILYVLASLAVPFTVLYVVIHFLLKVW